MKLSAFASKGVYLLNNLVDALDNMKERRDDMDSKLEYAGEFMKHIVAHMVEGGSFRYLIYERLGFDMDAYVSLYEAGGMEFSNACPVNMDPEVAPQFAYAGVGTITEIDASEKSPRVYVEFTQADDDDDGNMNPNWYDVWPGHSFVVGDSALCVYLSQQSSGSKYALEVGRNYSAYDLANIK